MKIKLIDKKCLPKYSSMNDAGMDCFAREDTFFYEQDGVYRANVPLGFGLECPQDYGVFVMPRSGLARKKNINLVNSVGLGDRSFGSNEYQAMLVYHGKTKPETIKKYQKICQIVIIRTPEIYFEVVDDFSIQEQPKDGFGSSGNF